MSTAPRLPASFATVGRLMFVVGSLILGVTFLTSFPVCTPSPFGQSAMPAGCLAGGPAPLSSVVFAPWTLGGLSLALGGRLLVSIADERAVDGSLVSALTQWLQEAVHRER